MGIKRRGPAALQLFKTAKHEISVREKHRKDKVRGWIRTSAPQIYRQSAPHLQVITARQRNRVPIADP